MQVLLNSMLKEDQLQAELPAAADASMNGHASASAEDNRPKPCVPEADQIRLHSAAQHSTGRAESMPQEVAAVHHDAPASTSMSRKAFKMDWDFLQHTKYPVMRLKQTSRPH